MWIPKGAVLVRGQHLLEGSTYLRPNTYWRKFDIILFHFGDNLIKFKIEFELYGLLPPINMYTGKWFKVSIPDFALFV